MMTLRTAIVAVALVLGPCVASPGVASAADYPGTKSDFHSFDRYDFQWQGHACRIVAPRTAAAGNPWIWRARFFGHEPQLDVELLGRGFHVAYIDVAGLYGAPQAVQIWNDFYGHVTSTFHFHPEPVLEGMSRGGLIVFNWAKANPNRVRCIYADAPVCDIKSWPGGKGSGKGSPGDWKRCLEAYGLSEAEALDSQPPKSRCNPIDALEPLAAAGVPILCVVGDADDVVPVDENTAILEQRYRELGGPIEVIHKPGVGHHPHSLKDPAPIVDFMIRSGAIREDDHAD
ncbi:Alpha/beta hydrolase family protein [Stieleria maiorica]|uniref:Alpha/beta hydrolase family protein n=1 Tax=Stieleria maiorica TaxID=2795974 RepID=A0A5B9MG28_9BACT|nr:prolyl oligopeptidase family serine peptidase [Stieleria maiorica]QEF99056.1 Alpha/beta hydrolase family protein [Stieleria maiorica]